MNGIYCTLTTDDYRAILYSIAVDSLQYPTGQPLRRILEITDKLFA